jgi:hypothetical protein
MSNLERCLESLGFCHRQDEPQWPAARIVAQQDIDEFIKEAGPTAADKHKALVQLMEEFARRFSDEADPVLIRSYMRGQMRRIGYELQRDEGRTEDMGTSRESPEKQQ